MAKSKRVQARRTPISVGGAVAFVGGVLSVFIAITQGLVVTSRIPYFAYAAIMSAVLIWAFVKHMWFPHVEEAPVRLVKCGKHTMPIAGCGKRVPEWFIGDDDICEACWGSLGRYPSKGETEYAFRKAEKREQRDLDKFVKKTNKEFPLLSVEEGKRQIEELLVKSAAMLSGNGKRKVRIASDGTDQESESESLAEDENIEQPKKRHE